MQTTLSWSFPKLSPSKLKCNNSNFYAEKNTPSQQCNLHHGWYENFSMSVSSLSNMQNCIFGPSHFVKVGLDTFYGLSWVWRWTPISLLCPIVSFLHFCHGASLSSRVQWLLQRVEFVSFNSFMITIRQSKNVKFDIISPGLAWLLLRCECVPVIQVIFHSDSAWLVIWTGDSPWNIQLAIRSYVPETQIVLLSKW